MKKYFVPNISNFSGYLFSFQNFALGSVKSISKSMLLSIVGWFSLLHVLYLRWMNRKEVNLSMNKRMNGKSTISCIVSGFHTFFHQHHVEHQHHETIQVGSIQSWKFCKIVYMVDTKVFIFAWNNDSTCALYWESSLPLFLVLQCQWLSFGVCFFPECL